MGDRRRADRSREASVSTLGAAQRRLESSKIASRRASVATRERGPPEEPSPQRCRVRHPRSPLHAATEPRCTVPPHQARRECARLEFGGTVLMRAGSQHLGAFCLQQASLSKRGTFRARWLHAQRTSIRRKQVWHRASSCAASECGGTPEGRGRPPSDGARVAHALGSRSSSERARANRRAIGRRSSMGEHYYPDDRVAGRGGTAGQAARR